MTLEIIRPRQLHREKKLNKVTKTSSSSNNETSIIASITFAVDTEKKNAKKVIGRTKK